MTPPGRDTNPLQVSPQQKLVLILPTLKGWKVESALAEKMVTQMFNTWLSWDLNPGSCGHHCANHITINQITVFVNSVSFQWYDNKGLSVICLIKKQVEHSASVSACKPFYCNIIEMCYVYLKETV